MMRYVSIVFVLAACGCAQTRQELTLAHAIEVPQHWRSGSESPHHPEFGVIHRYVSAYDRGWWIAVERYMEDIDFEDSSPLAMSGWPEEAAGGADGYYTRTRENGAVDPFFWEGASFRVFTAVQTRNAEAVDDTFA